MRENEKADLIHKALDTFSIEVPSWGFANTGTRFGKFLQLAAATTLEEKFADAGLVHRLTGISPLLALHVEWDLPNGIEDISKIRRLEEQHGIRTGSIHPNLFQSQEYKFGSICNPDPAIRAKAERHLLASAAIARQIGSGDLSLWIADGSNYPGTQSIRRRIEWMREILGNVHAALGPSQRMLIEYKPFEPAFYHTDIADWGMALELARAAGPQARVLVDTGHHYPSQNIEQIVAWLLHLNMLGAFHFNDRRYADDDLTLGSIDPYQVFRIFHELLSDPAASAGIVFTIDQSHNLKGKIEAMIQTACAAQELWARAALVDRERLAELQQSCRLVDAEECFRAAFWEDVRPAVREWRRAHNLPEKPIQALRESGYLERITRERGEKNAATVTSYA